MWKPSPDPRSIFLPYGEVAPEDCHSLPATCRVLIRMRNGDRVTTCGQGLARSYDQWAGAGSIRDVWMLD